uniref:IQ motif and ubiquitin-like domain-containing protein n=1 Tax=Physcomitrium patens TaxID=3218 RepID=A0A7I4C204_PHYPA
MMAFPRGLHAVHCVHPPLPESPSPSKRSPTPPACSPPRPSSPPKNQFLMQLFRDSNPEPIILTVNIDRSEKEPMAYRGGFKDIRTGIEYLNAVAQTLELWPPGKKLKTYPVMMSRETQLSWLRTRVHQTYREAFTQMDKNPTYWSLDKNGVVISDTFDYYKIPGLYEDSDAWERKRIAAVIFIQKHTRRKIAQRTANRMRQYAAKMKEFWIVRDRINKENAEARVQYEIQRRLHPSTLNDFNLLCKELETWQVEEYRRLNAKNLEGEEKKKACKELMEKQLKLIQTIDNLKLKTEVVVHRRMIERKLTTMALPKVWELTNGQLINVTTPATIRAGELGQVFDTVLTREILNLIQREADLMYRGRSAKSISGLRKRILHRFWAFVEDPLYNPEAQMFANEPTDFDYGNKHFQCMRDALNKFP